MGMGCTLIVKDASYGILLLIARMIKVFIGKANIGVPLITPVVVFKFKLASAKVG